MSGKKSNLCNNLTNNPASIKKKNSVSWNGDVKFDLTSLTTVNKKQQCNIKEEAEKIENENKGRTRSRDKDKTNSGSVGLKKYSRKIEEISLFNPQENEKKGIDFQNLKAETKEKRLQNLKMY